MSIDCFYYLMIWIIVFSFVLKNVFLLLHNLFFHFFSFASFILHFYLHFSTLLHRLRPYAAFNFILFFHLFCFIWFHFASFSFDFYFCLELFLFYV